MAQDLLRDVFRTGDADGRTRRRLSLLPLSIAAHAAAVAALVIVPLAAEVELPVPWPLARDVVQMMPTVVPPMPVPPRPAATAPPRVSRDAAPIEPPPSIEPETPAEPDPGPPGPPVEGAIPLGSGAPSGSLFGRAAALPALPAPAIRQPIPVGGDIRTPRKISGAAPEYPAVARQARVEGRVVLQAVLDERGRVERIRVLSSVPLLDEAAMKAVRSWRYTPTLLNGVPVPVLMTITVQFTLRE